MPKECGIQVVLAELWKVRYAFSYLRLSGGGLHHLDAIIVLTKPSVRLAVVGYRFFMDVKIPTCSSSGFSSFEVSNDRVLLLLDTFVNLPARLLLARDELNLIAIIVYIDLSHPAYPTLSVSIYEYIIDTLIQVSSNISTAEGPWSLGRGMIPRGRPCSGGGCLSSLCQPILIR